MNALYNALYTITYKFLVQHFCHSFYKKLNYFFTY
jgi:hypothetical protein